MIKPFNLVEALKKQNAVLQSHVPGEFNIYEPITIIKVDKNHSGEMVVIYEENGIFRMATLEGKNLISGKTVLFLDEEDLGIDIVISQVRGKIVVAYALPDSPEDYRRRLLDGACGSGDMYVLRRIHLDKNGNNVGERK